MAEVGIRQLKQHTSEVLRRVREQGETVTITHRGRAIARLVPLSTSTDSLAMAATVWAEMDQLAQEIGAHWPVGVSALNAVHEQRREL